MKRLLALLLCLPLSLHAQKIEVINSTTGVKKPVTMSGGASISTAGAVTLSIGSGASGTLPVANGGTGLASGTSGGILAYTATGTLASSGLLAANALVVGGGAGVAPSTTTTGSGILAFLGTPSSANLASAITDETGSGALMFGTGPTIGGDATISITSTATNGTAGSGPFGVIGNSLLAGSLGYFASSSLTTGRGLDVAITGTAAGTGYGAVISNTRAGASSANVALQLTASGGSSNTALTVTAGASILASNSSSALAVGRLGATTPALNIDASTGSSITGMEILAGAATTGVDLRAIGETNVALRLDAKGSGTITIGGTSTGAITLTRATTLSNALTYGGVTLANAVTGTGNMVLSASPTGTGTWALPIITGTSLALGGATIGSNALAVTGTTLLGTTTVGRLNLGAAGSNASWVLIAGSYAACSRVDSSAASVDVTILGGTISAISSGTIGFTSGGAAAQDTSMTRGAAGVFALPGIAGTPQALSGAGAVNLTSLTTALTTAGTGDAITLANGIAGQIKTIVLDVLTSGGHTAVLTPTTKTGFSTVTFTAAGQSVALQYFTTRGWMVIGSYGTTIAP